MCAPRYIKISTEEMFHGKVVKRDKPYKKQSELNVREEWNEQEYMEI